MEAYNHLECEYNYRAAVKGSPQERKGAFGESGQAGRTCGQVLDRMTEAVNDALAMAPEDLRREYGSDCLRLYLLFMGTGRDYHLEESWDEDTMAGLFRYLGRVWRKWGPDGLANSGLPDRNPAAKETAEAAKETGKAAKWDDCAEFLPPFRQIIDQTLQGRYHAGLTMLMSLLKRKNSDDEGPDCQRYLRLLLPYAPCLSLTLLRQELPAAELPDTDTWMAELWNGDYAWPGETADGITWVEIPMQYNGKLYGHIWIRDNAGEQEAAAEAVGMLVLEKYMDRMSIILEGESLYRVYGKRYRVYYIPGRIINICDDYAGTGNIYMDK